mmetsp:Transcript_36917/g.115600  ORF Transcript_36917/g.115600 Transcript_36917/m.115600 type:complete len:410 (+) Transcript_36917:173-1402(+)
MTYLQLSFQANALVQQARRLRRARLHRVDVLGDLPRPAREGLRAELDVGRLGEQAPRAAHEEVRAVAEHGEAAALDGVEGHVLRLDVQRHLVLAVVLVHEPAADVSQRPVAVEAARRHPVAAHGVLAERDEAQEHDLLPRVLDDVRHALGLLDVERLARRLALAVDRHLDAGVVLHRLPRPLEALDVLAERAPRDKPRVQGADGDRGVLGRRKGRDQLEVAEEADGVLRLVRHRKLLQHLLDVEARVAPAEVQPKGLGVAELVGAASDGAQVGRRVQHQLINGRFADPRRAFGPLRPHELIHLRQPHGELAAQEMLLAVLAEDLLHREDHAAARVIADELLGRPRFRSCVRRHAVARQRREAVRHRRDLLLGHLNLRHAEVSKAAAASALIYLERLPQLRHGRRRETHR